MSEIDVGKKIAAKYELVRLLGKGAMGEVWLATHESLGGEFAVKLVKPGGGIDDESASGRFQLEAQISAKLSRKTRHIVSVSDHGEEDGLAYLVMEVLDGESLEARLQARPLELPLLVGIVAQIGRALSIAHAEGIFHRDLKPANVFLSRDEDGRLLVKLLDFGIARSNKPVRTRSPFATGKDMVLGTPSYMSPEQARGLETLDYRCDLWALAVVAYEALTRELPWEGDTVEDIFLAICTHKYVPIRARRPELPPELDAVFARAFAPRLDDRFRQASELVASFEALVTQEEVDDAIGAKPAPTSARRLETPRTPHELSPGSDVLAVALNEDTARMHKRSGGAGWLYATIGGVATVALIVALLLTFGSKASSAPPARDEKPSAAVVPPPSDVPPPEPKPLASVDTRTAPTAIAKPSAPPRPTSLAATKVPPTPPPPAEPLTAVAPTPAPAPKPTPSPSTPTKKADRGEIF